MMRYHVYSILILLGTAGCVSSNGFIAGQLRDKAIEEQLLKPGALDSPVPDGSYFTHHTFRLLGKFRIGHDWLWGARGCAYGSYSGKPPGAPLRIRDSLGEVSEVGGKTYYTADKSYAGTRKDGTTWQSDFDQYTRPEYTLKDGTKMKGFQSVCFEAWQSTHHFMSIYLNKRTLDKPNIFGRQDGEISYQVVGKNKWWVQKFPLTSGGSAGSITESWVLPIADTGYLFIFQFGANIESQNNPAAHAKMQATFRHLIESVKIEPLQ